MIQTVNLRTPQLIFDRFGSDEDRQAHEQECARIRKTMTVRFQVAPGASVTTPSGRVLVAGTEVTAAMLHGKPDVPAWKGLKDMVETGVVLEADSAGDDDQVASK